MKTFHHPLLLLLLLWVGSMHVVLAQQGKSTLFHFEDFTGKSKTNYEDRKNGITLRISQLYKNSKDIRIGSSTTSFSIQLSFPVGFQLAQIAVIHLPIGANTMAESDYLTADLFTPLGTFAREDTMVYWTPTDSDLQTLTIQGTGKKRIKSITITAQPPVITPPQISAPEAYTYHGQTYFIDSLPISLTADRGTIRYTTDGTTPTATSPLYTTPLTFSETFTLKAATFMPDGSSSSVSLLQATPYPFSGNGSLSLPYSVSDIAFLTHPDVRQAPTSGTWVAGQILGNIQPTGTITPEIETLTNIALGTPGGDHLSFDLNFDQLLTALSGERLIHTPVLLHGRFTYNATTQRPQLTPTDFERLRFVSDGHESIAISSHGYATFATRFPYTLPEGVEGAIALANHTHRVTFDWRYPSGSVVPAGTALLLRGTSGYYPCELIKGSTLTSAPSTANLLIGNTSSADLTTNTTGVTHYGLTIGSQGFGFYRRQADGQMTITPHRCGLAIDSSQGLAPSFVGLEPILTNLQRSTLPIEGPAKVYTLDGRYKGTTTDWPHLPKGLYIIKDKVTLK